GWFRDEFVKSLLPSDAEVGEASARLENLYQGSGRPVEEAPSVRLYTVASTRHGVRVGGELAKGKRVPYFTVFSYGAGDVIFAAVCFFAGYVIRGTSTSLDRLAVIEAHPGDDLGREWAGIRIRSASSTSYAVAADPLLVATRRSWKDAPGEATRVLQDEGRFA